MNALRQRMLEDMRVRKLSEHTMQAYVRYVRCFAEYVKKPLEEAGPEDVRAYQVFQADTLKASAGTLSHSASALRFFFKVTLRRDWSVEAIANPRREQRLPNVLSKQEVAHLLKVVTNSKHRAMLWTMYAAGLRASELTHLQISDIDSKQMLVRVRKGKGGKERLVPLSPALLKILRDYWRECRPSPWLFPRRAENAPMCRRAIHYMVTKAGIAAGIPRPLSPHCLRHSYATHLMDAGTNLRLIQRVLGHAHLSSTEKYTYVSSVMLNKVKSPLDEILAMG